MVDRISAPSGELKVEGWTGRRLRVNREACCTVVVIRWSARGIPRGIPRTWRVELCMGRAERQIIASGQTTTTEKKLTFDGGFLPPTAQ
jgi:hypothetical protein